MELLIIQSPATGPRVLDLASKCSSPRLSSTAGDYSISGENAFCFSGQSHSASLSADVIFAGGAIKPLKLLCPSQYQHIASAFPESPPSPKRMLTRAVSMASLHKKRNYNDYPLLTKAKQEQGEASYPRLVHQGDCTNKDEMSRMKI